MNKVENKKNKVGEENQIFESTGCSAVMTKTMAKDQKMMSSEVTKIALIMMVSSNLL